MISVTLADILLAQTGFKTARGGSGESSRVGAAGRDVTCS